MDGEGDTLPKLTIPPHTTAERLFAPDALDLPFEMSLDATFLPTTDANLSLFERPIQVGVDAKFTTPEHIIELKLAPTIINDDGRLEKPRPIGAVIITR